MKNKSAFETVIKKNSSDDSNLKNNGLICYDHKITIKDSIQSHLPISDNTGKSTDISIQKSGKWTAEEVNLG
jgi:hypothetical protein